MIRVFLKLTGEVWWDGFKGGIQFLLEIVHADGCAASIVSFRKALNDFVRGVRNFLRLGGLFCGLQLLLMAVQETAV